MLVFRKPLKIVSAFKIMQIIMNVCDMDTIIHNKSQSEGNDQTEFQHSALKVTTD